MIPVNTLTVAWAALASSAEKIPDPNDVKPGWLGFVVVVALCAAVVFLLFSFRKQLRKVDSRLPHEKSESGPTAPRRTTGPGAAGGPDQPR